MSQMRRSKKQLREARACRCPQNAICHAAIDEWVIWQERSFLELDKDNSGSSSVPPFQFSLSGGLVRWLYHRAFLLRRLQRGLDEAEAAAMIKRVTLAIPPEAIRRLVEIGLR
jgi:hypothetical protein